METMTRKEGIIKEYTNTQTTNLNPANEAKLLNTEYLNYQELCDFCGEQAKTKEIFLNEKITPKN